MPDCIIDKAIQIKSGIKTTAEASDNPYTPAKT